MSEIIELTPTIKAVMMTKEDMLSDEEVKDVLATIPEETLTYYIDLMGNDTPKDLPVEDIEPATRMKRAGYTITDKADFYYFGHHKWSSRWGKKPNRVVWHHMAGNLTVKQFMAIMLSTRQMSPTISIHTDGTVYAWVPEEMRPWTTGSYEADQTALTFELANDQIGGQWHISNKVLDLAAQIHAEWSKRYGIPTTYSYRGAGINMHKDWAATSCPGPYLENLIRNGTITAKINYYLGIKPTPTPTPAKKPDQILTKGSKVKSYGFLVEQLKKEDGVWLMYNSWVGGWIPCADVDEVDARDGKKDQIVHIGSGCAFPGTYTIAEVDPYADRCRFEGFKYWVKCRCVEEVQEGK